MKTLTISKTRQKTANISEIDKISMGSIAVMGGISASIGIWSVLCFAAALLTNGPVNMLRGAIGAVMGI